MSYRKILFPILRICATLAVCAIAVLAMIVYGQYHLDQRAEGFCKGITTGANRAALLAAVSAVPDARVAFETPTQIDISVGGACHCILPRTGDEISGKGAVYCNG